MNKKKIRKSLRKRFKNQTMQIEYSSIRILTGSDLSKRMLPFMSIKSVNPGPVIWLTACVHGDEVGGIVVIQEIFKKLRKEGILKGDIYAFPLMNPLGFETGSRHITLSGEDLNRSFPGDKEGSLAERIANVIFTKIKETKPSLVLDLHNDWRKSIPHILIDPEPIEHKEAYEKTKAFSKKIKFPVVLDTVEVEKTLTYSLLKKGIPAFAVELGESYAVNEKDVEHGVKAIWNLLTDLEMVKSFESPFNIFLSEKIKNRILKYSQQVSLTSGIIRFLVKPGEIVKKGQPLAKIYNAFGKLVEVVKALDEGIVLGYSDSSVAFPGTPIIAFGLI